MGLVKALAIIVSLVLIAAFFLPYRALNEEGKAALELLRAMYSGAELERAAKEENFPLSRLDDDSLSAFELCAWYTQDAFRVEDDFSAALVTAVMAAGGALALLAFLFSLAKKPVLLFLSAGAALLYELRFFQPFIAQELPDRAWTSGIAATVYPVAAAALLLLAVILFVCKRAQKARS